jgi:DNA topoisomerase-1
MSKTLFIVESPNKAKSIAKYFPDFAVLATVGHFRDLPVDELGVDTDTHKPTYVTMDGKSDLVSRLKSAARNAQEIILATDPDREGEAIAAHVAYVLGREQAPKISRVTYQEVTKPAIQAALKKKRAIDWKLVKAQEGRRVLDRYVGYLVSPVLTNKFHSVQSMNYLSAGRVQSVALRLVVERAEEIENFKSIEHYGVLAHLIHAGVAFTAEWIRLNAMGEFIKELVRDKHLADQVSLRTKALKLVKMEKTKVKVSPPAPLTTSSYVKLVAGRFRLTTKQAMEVAQKLFEQGLITYHRTDSPYMSEDFALQVRAYAANNKLPVPHAVRQFKAKAGAQEAHECLRVTDINKAQVMLSDPLLEKIYRVIWEITLGAQLADGIDERTTARWINQFQDYFISRGRVVLDPGYRRVKSLGLDSDAGAEGEGDAGNNKGAGEESSPDKEQSLPALAEGQILRPSEVELLTKHTQQPPLFTERTLVAKLEALAIGRPATYASVIETIVKRCYVERSGKTLIFTPSPIGRAVVMALRPLFSFLNYSYTAEAEAQFDLIADGKSSYDTVIADAYMKLIAEIGQFTQQTLASATIQAISTVEPSNTNSKATSNRSRTAMKVDSKPKTAGKKSEPSEISTSGKTRTGKAADEGKAPCPSCGEGRLSLRTAKVGERAGSAFFGCSRYPHCRYTEQLPTRDKPVYNIH